MKQYIIKLHMTATYTAVVEGDFQNEGEALDAARNQMEDADNIEFTLGNEQEAEIVNVYCYD